MRTLALCGAIAVSTGSLWRKCCREWNESLGGGGAAGYVVGNGRVLSLPLVMDMMIFDFRGKSTKAHKFGLCCYRYLLSGSFAKLPEINDGKYNEMLLLLLLNKCDR